MRLFKIRLFKYLRKGILFLFIIPVIYLAIQVYFAFQNNYITQIAVEHQLNESISTIGIAVRDELLVESNTQGVLRYIPDEGERISKDSEIAYVYSNLDTAQDNVRLDREREELQVLQDSVINADNITGDISNIAKQQLDAYYELLDVVNSEEFSEIHDPKNELLLNYNKMQLAMDVPCDVTSALAAVESSVNLLSIQTTPNTIITSPEVGYFFRNTDGGELLYNSEIAQQWTSSELEQEIEFAKNMSIREDLIGKIVLDYRWEYYCIVSEVDSGRLRVGGNYEINFADSGSQAIPVELVRMDEPDENGNVLLQFSCETLTSDVSTLRVANAEIIIRNYNGITVSRDALRIIDGEKGVFVQFGNLIQFKKIAPLFENDEYMILPFENDEENEVKLYDVVVVEGRNLYDGKFL